MLYGIFFATGVCFGAVFGFLVAKCAIAPPPSSVKVPVAPVRGPYWEPAWEYRTTTKTKTVTQEEGARG